jgi:hypothetical protein
MTILFIPTKVKYQLVVRGMLEHQHLVQRLSLLHATNYASLARDLQVVMVDDGGYELSTSLIVPSLKNGRKK